MALSELESARVGKAVHGYEPAPEVATIATAAWRSQKAPSVGAFFAEGGSL